ncbi:MAG: hypothetical protein WC458_02250 [Patescibacteria group bacterium]
MKKLNANWKNLGFSKSLIEILGSRSAEEATVVNRINFFYLFLGLFGRLFITVEELSHLYFYLPAKRQSELKNHLDKISGDSMGWKRFYSSCFSESLKSMAVNEMLRRATIFFQAQIAFGLVGTNLELRAEALRTLKTLALKFEEKVEFIILSGELPGLTELENLLNSANNFSAVMRFLGIPKLPPILRNKAVAKMFGFSDDFSKLARTHHFSRPGSPLRRDIVLAAESYELDQKNLLDAYAMEKHWTKMKRMLFEKIKKLVLGIEDWLGILLQYGYDRKITDLAIEKLRALGLTFDQLNNSLNGVKEPQIKKVVLKEMSRLAKDEDFNKWKIICSKSNEFPNIFAKAFAKLILAAQTPEQSEEVLTLMIKNKNRKQINSFLNKLLRLENTKFETLEKIGLYCSRMSRKLLLPSLRRLAGDFDLLVRAFKFGENDKRHREKCLEDMFALVKINHNDEQLIQVYKLALAINNKVISERIIRIVARLDYGFSPLFDLYKLMEREKVTNNGLADLVQKNLIEKAQTEMEKRQAFFTASLPNRRLALLKIAA